MEAVVLLYPLIAMFGLYALYSLIKTNTTVSAKIRQATISEHRSGLTIVTIDYMDGSQCQYIGDRSVWHTYPGFEQCDRVMEMLLFEIQEYVNEHGNPYPTAKKKL